MYYFLENKKKQIYLKQIISNIKQNNHSYNARWMKEHRYKMYDKEVWFAIFSHEKYFSFFKMLARICKAMTFSRRLKYKWKGNRWSVAIVAAEKSSAFARELPVIHYIHVINANAGWASVSESLYNSCNITTCVTRLLALVTRLRMAHFIVLLSRAPLSSPLFTLAFSHPSLEGLKCSQGKDIYQIKNIHVNVYSILFSD